MPANSRWDLIQRLKGVNLFGVFTLFLHYGFLYSLFDYRMQLCEDGSKDLHRPKLRPCSVEIPTRCSFEIEFIILKFFKGSTCFERHTAHYQEL